MAPSSSPPGSRRQTYDLDSARITIALDAGPRIMGYERFGLPDLLAHLPDAAIEHPSVGMFRFIGGHRLWRAPEVPHVTYQPDEQDVEVEHHDHSLTVVGGPDKDGIVKVLELEHREPLTVVDHILRNEGSRRVRTAAWAITQLRPGGVALVPQGRVVDVDEVRPNRSITLWPYTDVSDPTVAFERHLITISSSLTSSQWKVGQPNRDGWLAYAHDGSLFVKWAPIHEDGNRYPHLGASVECYRDHRFVELESLSPVVELPPGGEVRHREVWTMMHADDGERNQVLESLPLDPLTAAGSEGATVRT